MDEKLQIAKALRQMPENDMRELARELRVGHDKLRRWAWDYPVETEDALRAAREVC